MCRPIEAHPQFRLTDSHRRVLRYVQNHPGCTKFAAAQAGTYCSLRNPRRQYYLVNTLLRHGYLFEGDESRPHKYSLYHWED